MYDICLNRIIYESQKDVIYFIEVYNILTLNKYK